jgi:hypothetical protein
MSKLNQNVESKIPMQEILWSRRMWQSVNDGGTWAIPRSGLMMERTPTGFSLVSVMPFTPEMATAAAEGRDVPKTAAELLAYQKYDFGFIQSRFEAAGLIFDDRNGLLGGPTLKDLQDKIDGAK